jgi:hypothetical protein
MTGIAAPSPLQRRWRSSHLRLGSYNRLDHVATPRLADGATAISSFLTLMFAHRGAASEHGQLITSCHV